MGCIVNYRLFGLDVLSGVTAVVEYDRLFYDTVSGFVYGVEETRKTGCPDLLDKAIQAIAGSSALPWIPYRVSGNVVLEARNYSSVTRAMVHRVAPPQETQLEGSCGDAILLDVLYGEIAAVAKLLAVQPAPKTVYQGILEASAGNTASLLEDSEELKGIFSYIAGLSPVVAVNLDKMNKLVYSIQETVEDQIIGDYVTRKTREIEGVQHLEEFKEKCRDKEISLLILVPNIHVPYTLKKSIQKLINELSETGVISYDTRVHLIGYSHGPLQQARNTLIQKGYSHIEHHTVKPGETNRQLASLHGETGECVLTGIILDFGKEDYKQLRETLKDKTVLNALIANRIKYVIRRAEISWDKDQTVVYWPG